MKVPRSLNPVLPGLMFSIILVIYKSLALNSWMSLLAVSAGATVQVFLLFIGMGKVRGTHEVAVFAISAALGASIIGWVPLQENTHFQHWNYHVCYWIAAATSVLCALILICLNPDDKAKEPKHDFDLFIVGPPLDLEKITERPDEEDRYTQTSPGQSPAH
jgi:sugar phosphate permease